MDDGRSCQGKMLLVIVTIESFTFNFCQILMSVLITMVVVTILVSTLMEVILVSAAMDYDYYLIRSLVNVSQQRNCMFLTYNWPVYFVNSIISKLHSW